MPRSRTPRAGSSSSQDDAAGGDAGACGDEHVLDVGDLVHGRSTDLANAFGDAVHAVDVRLAELAAVRVDGQAAARPHPDIADEVLRLSPAAEPELLELEQHERRERV